MTEEETIIQLKDLVRRHQVCYEVWPETLATRAGVVKVGFDLELDGAHEHPGSSALTAHIDDMGLAVATQPSHLPVCKARFATASSFNLRSSAFRYLRSRESSATTTAAATTARANHLLSAGTTYHGAAFVAVFRIISSYASM